MPTETTAKMVQRQRQIHLAIHIALMMLALTEAAQQLRQEAQTTRRHAMPMSPVQMQDADMTASISRMIIAILVALQELRQELTVR